MLLPDFKQATNKDASDERGENEQGDGCHGTSPLYIEEPEPRLRKREQRPAR